MLEETHGNLKTNWIIVFLIMHTKYYINNPYLTGSKPFFSICVPFNSKKCVLLHWSWVKWCNRHVTFKIHQCSGIFKSILVQNFDCIATRLSYTTATLKQYLCPLSHILSHFLQPSFVVVHYSCHPTSTQLATLTKTYVTLTELLCL